MRAKEFDIKPRNFVAKNAKMGGAGQHKDKKKAAKQGDVKHKNKQMDIAEGYTTEKQILTRIRQIMYDRKLSGTDSNTGELNRLKQQLKDIRSQQGVAEEWSHMTMEDSLNELSTEKLAQYKKSAYADAKKADSDGNYSRGDKRFKGINKATNKQFDNDLKKHGQDVKEGSKKIPFAGQKVGQKEGPAGQLKGTDPKGYPKGKLVGGGM